MTERFDNRPAQIAGSACAAVFLVIGLSGLAMPDSRIEALVWTLLAGFALHRSLNSSRATLDESGITLRSMFRTRRFALDDVSRAEVGVGRTGFAGRNREYLTFHLADGRRIEFKDLNAPVRPFGATSVVRQAVTHVNEKLAAR